MNDDKVFIGTLLEETYTLTYVEVCQKYNIPEALLDEMMQHGLFEEQVSAQKKDHFSANELKRIESAFRLHRDLDINLPGVVLAIELLERIARMEEELKIMRKHLHHD
ncbi:MAG: molecular chaperone [Legionella sp. 40-6]|nr:molecular chaperone [Legionella sp.]OJY36663.1 MAG: molecular chaperone [Legionella sp. 40-6]